MYRSSLAWSSPLEGWHKKALLTPFPEPHTFTPSRERLILALLLNAQVEHEGISLALFSEPDSSKIIAVDARGRVLFVTSDEDSRGLISLSQKALELPKAGTFWNCWRIKHMDTCHASDRLFISTRSPNVGDKGKKDFYQVSVYGYWKEGRELSNRVEGCTELPDVLWELFGLLLEARVDAGSPWDTNIRDEVVLGKVREILGDLFRLTS